MGGEMRIIIETKAESITHTNTDPPQYKITIVGTGLEQECELLEKYILKFREKESS